METGSLVLQLDGQGIGAVGRSAVIGKKKLTTKILGNRLARQPSNTGRTVGHVPDRWIDPLRLPLTIGIEHTLGHPHGTGGMELAPIKDLAVMMRGLVGHVPSGVGVFQNVNDASLVANVAGIVEGEEVAMVVEGQLLRVAQSHGMDLQAGTVRLATKDCSPARSLVHFAGGVREVITTIADGEVQPAVEAADYAVQVMPDKGDAHAIAFGDRDVIVGHPVVVLVGHLPDRRDASEVDGIVFGEDGKTYAVERLVEMIGKQTTLVGHPVAIGILQANKAIRHLGIPLGILVLWTGSMAGDMLVIQLLPVFHRNRSKITPRHLLGPTKVRHPEPKAVGLRHEDATARINAQTGRVLDMWISSPSVADVTVVLDHSTKRSLLVFEGRHFVLGHGKWIGHAGLKKASRRKDNEGGKGEDSHIEQFRS